MERDRLERVSEMKVAIIKEIIVIFQRRLWCIGDTLDRDHEVKLELKNTIKGLIDERYKGVLSISYLRSSYIVKDHEFFIAYYDTDVFVEENPESTYYSMKAIIGNIEDDWAEINAILRKRFIRLLPAEVEEICRWYTEQIYMELGTIMHRKLESLWRGFKIPILYGGYMEEVAIILTDRIT